MVEIYRISRLYSCTAAVIFASMIARESAIAAAIAFAAAIAAYMADMPCAVNPNGIVVRSVRRAGGFNAASRYERMNNRI